MLSPVLDTPEFFWHAPDAFLTLYKRVNEYLELGERVELLNSRFTVLQVRTSYINVLRFVRLRDGVILTRAPSVD